MQKVYQISLHLHKMKVEEMRWTQRGKLWKRSKGNYRVDELF